MSAASKTLWKKYVGAYHGFWDYLEEHEEILQERNNVTLVCGIMEECPVVNFSCVRDLIFTMRQFLGEKRFKEKESQWKECLVSKMKRCIVAVCSTEKEEGEEEEEEDQCTEVIISKADLGVEVTSNFLQKDPLTYDVLKEFTRRAGRLLEKQDCLRKLPDRRYKCQVYGQHIYRQQALILNFNILRTFCNNLMRYFNVKPSTCGNVLQRLAREAFEHKAMRTQATEYYFRVTDQSTLTRISIWPLHEPVVSSYDHRKEALSKRWKAAKCPKSIVPPIYTPLVLSGSVVLFKKTTEENKTLVTPDSIPLKITGSKHFEQMMNIVQNGYAALNHDETNPTKKSNWLYYCVMFDPTVSPEAADQGYIGKTTRDLVTRWKEHTGPKGKHDDMLIHYNLALVSEYARQRGKDLSEYVAVFALGTTTDESALAKTEGRLIRKSFSDGFGVTNMKYGMNCKQSSVKQQQRAKIPLHQKSRTPMKKAAGLHHIRSFHSLSNRSSNYTPH